MKKYLPIFIFIAFFVLVSAFLYLPIKSVLALPNEIYVTYDDVQNANKNNTFSSAIKLDINENIAVSNKDIVPTSISIKLFGFIPIKNLNVNLIQDTSVFVGGNTIGFNLKSDGVIIVGSNKVKTSDGEISPFDESELKVGDAIKEIENTKIENIQNIGEILNSMDNQGEEINVKVLRDGKTINCKISPALDKYTNEYKLGLWVRNNASGVGTLSYVKKNNNRFGAVGHPIIDQNLSSNFEIENGKVYLCDVIGIKKGTSSKPGELKATIDFDEDEIGVADTNCKYGVYGNLHNLDEFDDFLNAEVGGRLSVKVGNAKIYTSLDGDEVKAYDIKIIKTNRQKKADDKSIVFKVTDKELIAKTGGIVQGMSGSPIVQNGKLIGAVTHVFLNDPTKGYGVYVDWMIDN